MKSDEAHGTLLYNYRKMGNGIRERYNKNWGFMAQIGNFIANYGDPSWVMELTDEITKGQATVTHGCWDGSIVGIIN